MQCIQEKQKFEKNSKTKERVKINRTSRISVVSPTHLSNDLYASISNVCPIPREALLDHLVLYV